MVKSRKVSDAADRTVFYVSPEGKNSWSGRLPESNARGTDGPLASVKGAQKKVRPLVKEGLDKPVEVLLRGGTYFLSSPLIFTSADSGRLRLARGKSVDEPSLTVTYRAYPGEHPAISGGKRISGWKATEVNGHAAWVASVPGVAQGKWYFQQLWVDGERRMRSRLPEKGLYRIERLIGVSGKTPYHQGQDRFVYGKGDIDPKWHNLGDVEVVGLSYWTESRMWIKEIDRRRRLAIFDRVSSKRLSDDFDAGRPTQYYVENVLEALRPGEWYLDRAEGKLYYLPLPGEEMGKAEVIAPRLTEIVRIEGKKEPVRQLCFEGIVFSHNQWDLPVDMSNVGQSSHQIPGAVVLSNVWGCEFKQCAFVHLGSYGVELADSCCDVELIGCDVIDLGAGGVKIWHGCRRNAVSDCVIADGGILYPSAVGVLVGRASGNKVVHNHIHDFFYTGISVGWCWGYAESEGYGNIIEYNHVHDIGHGMLSDMGGIYSLGVSPGTRIRNNIFHDISSRGYGGWAIYTDEGSTDILIENNLAYRTNCSAFHQHYGRDNLIQNNIWAFGRQEQLALTRLEQHCSFIFRNNIVYFDEGELFASNLRKATGDHVSFDGNLYWRVGGKKFRFGEKTFRQWQQTGMDRNSAIADPGFAAPEKDDFRLKKNSPALKIGFRPFDLLDVGPREEVRGK